LTPELDLPKFLGQPEREMRRPAGVNVLHAQHRVASVDPLADRPSAASINRINVSLGRRSAAVANSSPP
jgi:hypothetical protein